MRVDDEIRCDTFAGERHVFLLVTHAYSAFLAVAGGKLVTDLRDTDRSHLDLGEAVAIFVGRQNYCVNHTFLRVFELCRAVFAGL